MAAAEAWHALLTSHASLDTGMLRAGYTYLGQLVAHDITTKTMPPIEREATPWLNLDSLYGAGEGDSSLRDGARMRFRKGDAATPADLWRVDGIAQIPDARNDVNTIVSQLHLLCLRLHNALIDARLARTFVEARDIVVRLMQVIVVEDYLRRLLDPEVYRFLIDEGRRPWEIAPAQIPPAFSHGVFRFGHAMVRDRYVLRPNTRSQPLAALLRSGEALTRTFEVDWPSFFDPGTAVGQSTLAIDHRITPAMRHVPHPIPRGAVRGTPREAPVDVIAANLRAGCQAKVPRAGELIDELLAGPDGRDLRERLGLALIDLPTPLQRDLPADGAAIDRMPLWTYTLLEAPTHGRRLGVLASLVTGQVLAQAAATGARPF
ncbi:MAG: peroxidase family protein, partial [Pseudomonadota bacterium]